MTSKNLVIPYLIKKKKKKNPTKQLTKFFIKTIDVVYDKLGQCNSISLQFHKVTVQSLYTTILSFSNLNNCLLAISKGLIIN